MRPASQLTMASGRPPDRPRRATAPSVTRNGIRKWPVSRRVNSSKAPAYDGGLIERVGARCAL